MNRPDDQPFDVLLEMAARSRAAGRTAGADTDAQHHLEPYWTGVGFSVGPLRFVAPLGQVTEILVGVALTRLPRVKPWMKGVANVRGRLMPVMDLAQFLGLPSNPPAGRRQRALVLEIDETYCGLLVDEAHGLKHFGFEAYKEDTPGLPDAVKPFVAGLYDGADGTWTVFDTGALASDPHFLEAGA